MRTAMVWACRLISFAGAFCLWITYWQVLSAWMAKGLAFVVSLVVYPGALLVLFFPNTWREQTGYYEVSDDFFVIANLLFIVTAVVFGNLSQRLRG